MDQITVEYLEEELDRLEKELADLQLVADANKIAREFAND
jgi:hypothetical protein